MKSLISRLQGDLNQLQKTLQKEGNDLIKKVKGASLSKNIEVGRKEVEKLIGTKLKKLEPLYENFLEEIRKNAKKAGIDITKIEKEIKKTADVARKKLNIKETPKKGRKKKVVSKKAASKKVTAVKKPKTTKKVTVKKTKKKSEA